uniref:Uncharacterized protein n=1 Tax=Esox lucius TaxID=8010 RepID=A0A6Q2Y3M9_ESOLU
MRSSIDCPFSSFFSISISSLTPSTTICTSSTSEKPRRSALEISKVPPTAAVSTPPGIKAQHRRGTKYHHDNFRGILAINAGTIATPPQIWHVCSSLCPSSKGR